MNLVAILISLLALGLLIVLSFQMRSQRKATEELLADNRIRTRLYQDADESTTLILSRTIQNISVGHPDPNLESDSFTLNVVRELVKRKVSKEKWLEMQTNERLVHELYLLLRDAVVTKKGPRLVAQAK
jgi:type II secretory pathway pseudopilin PulG